MASRGAKNLILLSRSGPPSAAAKLLLDDLGISGVQVEAPACDITSYDSLSTVLAHSAKRLPPIKGLYPGGNGLEGRRPRFSSTVYRTTMLTPDRIRYSRR